MQTPSTAATPDLDSKVVKPPSELRTLLNLAWPLILSNSFSTIQITIDRIFLSKLSPDAVSAQTSAVMLFWCPFILFFSTANYVNTFVAQYFGAGRKHRVGAAVWQGIYFSLFAGVIAILCSEFAQSIVSISQHSSAIQEMESTYFVCLCWMAMPVLLMATVSAFFSGRGSTRVVIWINLVGTAVNAFLGWALIFGKWGFPQMGIAGAGWATVIASWASALLGLILMFQRQFRIEFATLASWRFDRKLFGRLMRYGLPSGFQWMLDTTAFTAFLIIMGWFGPTELGASSIAYTINCVVFIPMVGVGQSVAILVGQHLGQNRPQQAVKSTWSGLLVTFTYMLVVGSLFVIIPSVFIEPFRSDGDLNRWKEVANLLPKLLWFVFMYSLFDAFTLTFSFALRGAGDTLFVTLISLCLAWPLMVLPTWLAYQNHWGIYAGWTFVTLFIFAQGICFLLRFLAGKWKAMRVIEMGPESVVLDDQVRHPDDGTGRCESEAKSVYSRVQTLITSREFTPMNPAYHLADPDSVISPSLIFYKDLIRDNIAKVIEIAGSAAKLRPHVKTHKTREISQMEIQAGITKHKCATIAEAEMLAMVDAPDVLIAYPIVGPNAQRLAELMKRYPNTRFSALVDHPAAMAALGATLVRNGLVLDVLMDLNVGQNRTGIAVGEEAKSLYEQIARTPGLRPAGFHVYDGHNHQESFGERKAAVDALLVPVLKLRSELEQKGIPVPKLVCGGTPTFSVFAKMDFPGLECSPGTFVLYDNGYGSKFTDLSGLVPAALLLTRVISRPSATRVTFDLGYKAVASDPPAGKRCVLLDVPEHNVVLQNEEHLAIETPAAAKFKPGDVVYAIPTHICPTCAMHQRAYVVEGGRVTGTWDIIGRDRVLTI